METFGGMFWVYFCLEDKYPNLKNVVYNDFNQLNWNLFKNDFNVKVDIEKILCNKIIGNLPYYITTPIIFKFLESSLKWEKMFFLVQKEVAERITAQSGGKIYG